MYLAAMIVVMSVLPSPTYLQYYCVAVPFMIVGVVSFTAGISKFHGGLVAAVVLLITNLSFLMFDIPRYTSTGLGVIGVYDTDNVINWRLESVREVSREIDQRCVRGEEVLSFWPGYLLESAAACVPGMESHVGLSIVKHLTTARRSQYRIASAADIDAGLRLHQPCLAVLGNQQSMGVMSTKFAEMFERYGYRVSYSLGHTAIYTCK